MVLFNKWINKTVSIQQRWLIKFIMSLIILPLFFYGHMFVSVLEQTLLCSPFLTCSSAWEVFIPTLHILWDTQQKPVPFKWFMSQSNSPFFPSINSSGFVPGEKETLANQVCNILLKKNPWILWKWIRFSIFYYHLVDIWSEM